MVSPTFSISGLSSGLDTAGIIDSLVQIERQPIVRYQQRQAQLRARDDAWGTIVGRLSGLRSALDDVTDRDALRGLVTVSSSDEAAVSITATGQGSPGGLDVTVSRLAARHRIGMDGSYGTATSPVGAGTLTITDADGATIGEVTTDGSTTLLGLARQVDALGIGVDAQVLKVGEGDFQLVLTADDSGEAARFGASSTIAGLGTAVELELGEDALLELGSLQITRSSNVIDDLVEGATITLKQTTTQDVTLGVERDLDAVVGNVQAVVDGFNAVLDQVAALTRYDPETDEAGILQGDALARELSFDLRSTLTELVGQPGADLQYAGDLGLRLTREGKVELDEARLREALGDDFDAAVGFLSQSLTGDTGVELSYAGDDATSGSFTLDVSQAASVAAATGASFTPPTGSPKTFTITTGGTTVSVTIEEGMTAAQAVAQINAELDAAQVTSLRASEPGDGTLSLAATSAGSATEFTVSGYDDPLFGYAGLDGSYQGTDVAGTIDGTAFTGTGSSLEGVGAAAGLSLQVTGGVGSYALTYSDGVGGVIDRYVSRLEGRDGLIAGARESLDTSIRDFDAQIEQYEQRVALREGRLRRQFSALESTLGQLQAQGSWLAGQLGSLGGLQG